MKLNLKYIKKVLKFYSSGFIFSLGCSLILTIWFLWYPSTNEIGKINLFWINAIFYAFCFMCALGWLFLIDELETELKKEKL